MATRILVLDTDQETLIALQQVLEDGGFDTITTWDVAEARQLLRDTYFDFLIVGDHPPEMDAVAILREVHQHGCCGASIVLAGNRESQVERFRRVGAVGVIPHQEYDSLLDAVKRHVRILSFVRKPKPVAATEAASVIEATVSGSKAR
jgi:CheY-like chemotaxis protein